MPENFVLYWPRDVVAGGFYWVEEVGEYVFVAVGDCTRHGVPGAMMSVLCRGALSRAVVEEGIVDTGLILDRVREEMVARVHRGDVDLRDGMDGVLLRFQRGDLRWLQLSGANLGLWVVRASGEFLEVEGDWQPVGYAEWARPFRSVEVVEAGSMLHLPRTGMWINLGVLLGASWARSGFGSWWWRYGSGRARCNGSGWGSILRAGEGVCRRWTM